MDKKEFDDIGVVLLPAPSGISRGSAQEYEITVAPREESGQAFPILPFLHKGDGITVPGADSYWVQSARQVPTIERGYVTGWTWVYRVTRDTSNDPEPWDDGAPFGTSQFER